jgi:hypothetical protein
MLSVAVKPVMLGAVMPSVLIPSVYMLIVVILSAGNTKGGSITVLMTSCLTGLESVV